MDILTILAGVLLVAGVIGSFLPLVPGAFISILGISVFWWSNGFTSPSILIVSVMYLTAVTALFFDMFAGAIGSKAGGASNKTVQMSAIAGILFFFIAGPLGTIIGIAVVVYLREYLLTGESSKSSKAALYSTISVLGSSLIQGAMTSLTLIIFLLVLIF